MVRTYESMAHELGVRYCRGITTTGHYCHVGRHDLEGTAAEDAVHFTDRPVTRANTLAFLKLAAKVEDPTLDDEPLAWRRVYRMDMMVRRYSRTLHVRVPATLMRSDRAFVLAGVAGVPNSIPLRKQAFDWARRGPKGDRHGHQPQDRDHGTADAG